MKHVRKKKQCLISPLNRVTQPKNCAEIEPSPLFAFATLVCVLFPVVASSQVRNFCILVLIFSRSRCYFQDLRFILTLKCDNLSSYDKILFYSYRIYYFILLYTYMLCTYMSEMKRHQGLSFETFGKISKTLV